MSTYSFICNDNEVNTLDLLSRDKIIRYDDIIGFPYNIMNDNKYFVKMNKTGISFYTKDFQVEYQLDFSVSEEFKNFLNKLLMKEEIEELIKLLGDIAKSDVKIF